MISTGDILTKYIKLSSLEKVSELRYDSKMQNLCIKLYAVKSLTFKKSLDVMLFNSNDIWEIFERTWLGPGFNSLSPLSLTNLI